MKRKRQSAAASPLKSLLFGTLLALLSLVACSFILSFVTFFLPDPSRFMGAASIAALLLSGAVSGYLISKFKAVSGILTAFLCCLFSSVILLGVALISAGGEITFGAPLGYAAYLGVAALFAALGAKKRKKRRAYR